jgi:hypothetical protein
MDHDLFPLVLDGFRASGSTWHRTTTRDDVTNRMYTVPSSSSTPLRSITTGTHGTSPYQVPGTVVREILDTTTEIKEHHLSRITTHYWSAIKAREELSEEQKAAFHRAVSSWSWVVES